jgi:hypothetical protein
MKKSIKIIDEKRGIAQITTADERWYTRLARLRGLAGFEDTPSL